MSSKARDLLSSTCADSEALKPEPSADLWEQMDAIQAEVSASLRPRDSITVREWATRYKIGETTALRQIRKCIAAGKLCRLGRGLYGKNNK